MGLSRGDFTWEQGMGFGSLGFASCDGSRVFRAGVVQWVLGVHRPLKNPEKIIERSSKPTTTSKPILVALNMQYRGLRCPRGPQMGKRLKITGAANSMNF